MEILFDLGLMRILGIDPGFDRTGMGVIEEKSGKLSWIHHACIQTDAKDDFSFRLQQVRDGVRRVIEEFRPEGAVIEQLFFQTNAKTAIKVGMARGVIFLALADAGIPIVEITPNQLKQGISGWGGAGKKQVQEMVKRLLHLKEVPKPDDAADALAMAIVGSPMLRRKR
jgi:crossover junction endodeoxyribonuclease RuvC